MQRTTKKAKSSSARRISLFRYAQQDRIYYKAVEEDGKVFFHPLNPNQLQIVQLVVDSHEFIAYANKDRFEQKQDGQPVEPFTIIEAISGRSLGCANSIGEAKRLLRDSIDKVGGIDRLKDIVDDFVGKSAASPTFHVTRFTEVIPMRFPN
jgi:hypothetical protein